MRQILSSILVLSFCLLAVPMSVQAKDILGPSAECSNGTAGTGSSAVCTDDSNTSAANDPIVSKLRNIARIIAFIAGAAAIILILVGSLQYVTSNGDSNKIKSARDTVIYALIGLVVIVLAATIIEFVLNKL